MGDSSPTSHSTLCVTPVVCGSCADGIGRHTERRISAPRAYDHNLVAFNPSLCGIVDISSFLPTLSFNFMNTNVTLTNDTNLRNEGVYPRRDFVAWRG